jgi:hypothetical protein
MADMKEEKEIVDVNLLEQGLISVWYDNTGYICEAYWVRGLTYFTGCEHEGVLPLVDMKENLCGFMIQGVEWISEGRDGYVTVNLKSNLPEDATNSNPSGQTATAMIGKAYHNPIERGIIHARFDRAEHYCEVVWGDGNTRYIETENEYILALVNADGILSGFRITNTDRLAENPIGCVGAELKTKIGATAA